MYTTLRLYFKDCHMRDTVHHPKIINMQTQIRVRARLVHSCTMTRMQMGLRAQISCAWLHACMA